jgi:hypothetical protein
VLYQLSYCGTAPLKYPLEGGLARKAPNLPVGSA